MSNAAATGCRHRYVGNYAHMPRSMGRACPYPEIYAASQSLHELPVDERGACIFHSQDLAWKERSGFLERFVELVEFLNGDGSQEFFDFAEFVFSGGASDAASASAPSIFRLSDLAFRKQAYMVAASFPVPVEFDRIDFQEGAAFEAAEFAHDLKVHDTTIHGLNCCDITVAGVAAFDHVRFLDHALFNGARFTGTTPGRVVTFDGSRFEGISDFSDAVFLLGKESSVSFLHSRFEDLANFENTRFHGHVEFREVVFGSVTEFIDTAFDSIGSSARYRGAAVEFASIDVPSGATLTFKSTDPQKKLFEHDVQISFGEDPAGLIRFENVNFNMLSTKSRVRLTRLATSGVVEIGAGCIKYRHQTAARTIDVQEGNLPLVIELCHTFSNYFTQSSGMNLGVEIVDRDRTNLTFFYYTDEDISDEAFAERLARTERRLWNLLSVGTDDQLLVLEESENALPTARVSVVINAIDGLSALLGTFFRVGARIALGVWTAADTRALLSAIRFNETGSEDRAASLHRVLVEKYTGQTLFGINRQQNQILLPMPPVAGADGPAQKVRILFLTANSMTDPLDLDWELKTIRQNLRLARERDNLDLRHESAVTIDSLTQAMLDVSPHIVHFSGHGWESGIVLQDETRTERVVSGDALARLFALFTATVRCVVLSSCFSETQARAIRRHVPYVIGTKAEIPDVAALAFSGGFYQAIGAGREIPFAFALGIARIDLEGLDSEQIPILL